MFSPIWRVSCHIERRYDFHEWNVPYLASYVPCFFISASLLWGRSESGSVNFSPGLVVVVIGWFITRGIY